MFIAVNFHYIRPDFNTPYQGIFGVTPIQFRRQLEALSVIGNFIHQDELLHAISNNKVLEGNKILITFDDGLKEQYLYALPILEEMGIPVVFFVNTANTSEGKVSLVHKIHLLMANVPLKELHHGIMQIAAELTGKSLNETQKQKALLHYNYDIEEKALLKYYLNFVLNYEEQEDIIQKITASFLGINEKEFSRSYYMNIAELKDIMRKGCCGSHSHRHIPLGLYHNNEVIDDIAKSVNYLKEITGMAPVGISYPYGAEEASSSAVCSIAEGEGLKYGFTMERAGNIDFKNPLSLARFDCNDVPGGNHPLFDSNNFFDNIDIRKWNLN